MDHNIQNEHEFAAKILNTYIQRYAELDQAHAFHFASRLSHWTNSKWSADMLEKHRATMLSSTKDDDVTQQLRLIIQSGNEGLDMVNAASSRIPYFNKYPNLRGTTSALFRLRHWLEHYSFDARDIFIKKVMPLDELNQLQSTLFSDTKAVAVLSTHAINYYYLLNRLLLNNDKIPVSEIEKALNLYNTKNLEDILLYIYLLTHCIIGESLFYVHDITGDARQFYLGYMNTLLRLVTEHYDNINLDNKCEFLVCAALLMFDTGALRHKIFEEATQSISDDGFYIIDRHNNNPQVSRMDINRSEHRNVLFLMAFLR